MSGNKVVMLMCVSCVLMDFGMWINICFVVIFLLVFLSTVGW